MGVKSLFESRLARLSSFLGVLLSFILINPGMVCFADDPPDDPLPTTYENNFADITVGTATNTGAAAFSIPIEVPPGRQGIPAKLALTYNSNRKNGWIGVGWNLDLGAIQRATKRGVCYDCDDYVFVSNGSVVELTPRSDWGANYYGEKIERSFSRYYKSPSGGWIVTTKNGTIYKYGTYGANDVKPSTRQDNTYGVFKWCLDWVQDTNGNYMTAAYSKDGGEIYLERIDYTGNVSGLNPTNYVKFWLDDGTREDAPSMFTTNSKVVTKYRLKTIEVGSSVGLAKKYELIYDADLNTPGLQYSSSTGRSFLGKVTQYGSDGTTTLPSLTFEPTVMSNAWDLTAWDNLLLNDDRVYRYCLTGDLNGDGISDIWCYAGSGSWNVRISTGTGWSPATWSGPAPKAPINEYCMAGDINGDGKADMWCDNENDTWDIRISSGYGWPWPSGPISAESRVRLYDYCMSGDVDGDGKADLWCWISGRNWDIKTGAMWNSPSDRWSGPTIPDYMDGYIGYTSSLLCMPGDINGDGKTDMWCYTGGDIWDIRIPNGSQKKWETVDPALPTWHGPTMRAYPAAARMCLPGDLNGDGKTDMWCYKGSQNDLGVWLVSISTGYLDFSKGTGWIYPPLNWNGPVAYDLSINKYCMAGDLNGDGTTDMWCNRGGGNWDVGLSTGYGWIRSLWTGPAVAVNMTSRNCVAGRFSKDGRAAMACYNGSTHQWSIASPSGDVPDLISKISNGIGGTTTIAYTPSSFYTNTYLPFVVQTVSSITVNDGNGNISTTNYSYAGGLYSVAEREFRGFGSVVATVPESTITETYFHQDDIFKGLPYEQVVTDFSDNIYTWTTNTYQSRGYAGVNFPFLQQKDDYICDGTVRYSASPPVSCKHVQASFMDADYDNYGNITHKHYFGDVAVTGDEKDEYIDYNYDTTNYIVSLPSHTWTNDSSGTKKTETWFDYEPGKTNLKIKTLGLVLENKDDPRNPKIQYSYEYGNLKTVKDARGYTTTMGYYSASNPTYLYPVAITNQLNHTSSIVYDERYGKPLTVTDPNNNTVVTYQYDLFGRRITDIDSHIGQPAYTWQEKYYDGLGRTIKTRSAGPDGKVIVAETKYNNRGLVEKRSLPYFEDTETPRWTIYSYDPLGRVKDVQNPDGTVISKRYMQGRTTHVDENRHVKVEEKDAYERLSKVEEYTGSDPGVIYATTFYTYDVMGNLTKVIDAKSNQTTINYDPLSRKINMTDPDMGYWQYDYDPNGNLIWQKDAKSQTIQFQYDELNRVKLKDYQTGVDVNYTYDEPWSTNAKGRLTTVTDVSGTEKFYYDTLGRVASSVKTIDGIDYQLDVTYDALGRLDSIKYPAPSPAERETVYYVYDEAGNLISVPGYADFLDFNAGGQIESILYANSVYTIQQYHPLNNRLLATTTNSPVAGWLQDISYGVFDEHGTLISTGYDNAGNILNITDYITPARTQNFLYDDLNRLKQASSTDYGTISYQYDQIGNMTYNSQRGTYYYFNDSNCAYSSTPHAVCKVNTTDYRYDLNGNMISRPVSAISYDYDNRPSTIGSTNFVYDYAGQRVKKGGTVYIGKMYECTGGTCTKYIFANGNRVAAKTGAYVRFYHSDHLGSTNVVTDYNTLTGSGGSKVQENYYYPFGGARSGGSGSVTNYLFTGQESDPETGLYNYVGRHYDPVIGRFISADGIVPDPANPQSLNRYTYVLNNPLNYTDPTGQEYEFNNYGGTWDSYYYGSGSYMGSNWYGSGSTGYDFLTLNNYASISYYDGNSFSVDYGNGVTVGGSFGYADSFGSFGDSRNTGLFSGTQAYFGDRATDQYLHGNNFAGNVDCAIATAVDVLLPHSLYEVPLMFLGTGEIKGIGKLLMSEGKYLGQAGSTTSTRVITGGIEEAEKMFKTLSVGGQIMQNNTYPGTLIKTSEGLIGLRPISKTGPPTIDINIKGLGIKKIKFVE